MSKAQEERLEKLNKLAAKQRDVGLTEEEAKEQAALREEYRLAFRAAFRGVLENTYIQQPDGRRTKLQKKSGDRSGK